jgi:eukaryotic-like serine/threonine-protein kinase
MAGDADDDEVVRRAKLLIGAVLKHKWTIERLIGVGGMAVVYRATHRNKKRAAIKMLHPEFSLDQRIRARFLREGYVANTVGHPGAVRVDDDDVTEEGAAFLVMELLEGETVEARRLRHGGRLSPRAALPMMYQLLDVLAAAHAKGIVHRDLKPDNLFLNRDGQLKVLDFGIARLQELRDELVKTQAGALLGTPAFMAPEQARARWDLVDARTDLWAVGATLFTLLTGRFVHEAGTMNEALAMAVTQAPRPIASVLPGIHPLVAEVVDRALAYNPQQRYADARMMQEAVQTAYSALDEMATPLSAMLPAVTSAAPTPASIDVPIEIEATPPPSDVPLDPPLVTPNTLLASAPAVTAGARAQKASSRRSRMRLLAASGALLVAVAGGALLFVVKTPATEDLPPFAEKSEATSAPPIAKTSLVNAGEPVATLALRDPQQDEQPAAKVAPPSAPEPRAKVTAAKPARMRTQAPSSERPPPAPAKSSDPYARRR